MNNTVEKPKIVKKIDVKATIMKLNKGGAVTFKIANNLSAGKIRACVSRANNNKKVLRNFSTSENGLEIIVIRNH